MKKCSLAFLLSLLAGAALAAPPPGHPSPAAAAEMLAPLKPVPADQLPHEGSVVSVTQANEYSYVEVAAEGQTLWLAAPQMELKKGDVIRYEDGAVMTNFYSKLLKRTFPSIMFVGQVAVVDKKK